MRFSIFQESKTGGRKSNQDRMGYCYTRDAVLFALADGMGGHPEGEMAAQIALQTLAALFQVSAKPKIADPGTFLREAVMAAHHQLLGYAKERGLTDTPRTTVVACIVQGGMAQWVHCGDSRLYVVRHGELLMRTRDHSYLEKQSEGGARLEHITRNILFTCLGSATKPVFDVTGPVMLQQGDKLLLCSDGLWGSLSDDEIVKHLAGKGVSVAVPDLVENALRVAGEQSDNVTALAMEWETPDAFESTLGISTDSISDVVFASTIQAGGMDTCADDLDEATIERSIAEINEAIRRSAARKA